MDAYHFLDLLTFAMSTALMFVGLAVMVGLALLYARGYFE